jgi:hypothetical protein
MARLLLIIGAAGFVVGLGAVRVQMLALISTVLLMIWIAVSLIVQWGLAFSLGFCFALLGALQGGYLLGLMARGLWTRAKAPQAMRKSSHTDQCRT